MPGQFIPPDHSKGDEETIGGYAAVHDRPAAFEGSDGYSYSVEIMVERAEGQGPRAKGVWGAFFLFVKWARLGAQSPEGHLESDYLVMGTTEEQARRRIGELPLKAVKELLDVLIAARGEGASKRRWWDAMRDEGKGEGGGN